jgi:serine protease Do
MIQIPVRRLLSVLSIAVLSGGISSRASSLPDLWKERVKSVVAVDYFTELENERRPTTAYGVAIDTHGTVILPSAAVDPRISPKQLKDFKAYLPGDPTGFDAVYLGQDAFTGWHFVRVEPKLAAQLIPITSWAAPDKSPVPELADEVWGIGVRNKDEDFTPYLLDSHLALIQSLPQQVGIAQQEVAGPGLPVFNRDGVFIGLAASSFGQTFLQFSQADRGGTPIMLVDLEESSAFSLASEVLPYLGRVPGNVDGRPLAWLGAYGLESMDRDVANFLKLTDRSGAVVSEVLETSPAEKAGMKNGDVIVAIDGQPLPRFRPDRVVTDYVEREIERRKPGDVMGLTVLRGTETVELKATLGDEPKLIREAERKYFDRLGFTAREFVYGDAVARRVPIREAAGVVVSYVKPNSPAAAAGIEEDDWIKEIDGKAVKSFADGSAWLTAVEGDTLRTEFVLLVGRGTDTAILRVKLR